MRYRLDAIEGALVVRGHSAEPEQRIDHNQTAFQNQLAQQTQATQALQQRNRDLEQQLKNRTLELEQAQQTIHHLKTQLNQRSQLSRRIKSNLFHNLFHDLRTALSNISRTTEMLEVLLAQFPKTRSHTPPIEPYLQVLKDECSDGIRLIDARPDLQNPALTEIYEDKESAFSTIADDLE